MKIITSKDVVEFLDIPYQTLHLWTKRGILGPRFIATGPGSTRQFGLKELVILRVAQRFHSIAKEMEIIKQVAAELNRAWDTLDFDFTPFMVVTIYEGRLYNVVWAQPEIRYSEEWVKKGIITLISVKAIMDEARRFLENVGIEKQPALIK